MITAEAKVVSFKLNTLPIQYKKLLPEHFSWAKPETNYEVIQPDKRTGYVSDQLFESLSKDFHNSNTCIINVGVGRGKTTTACNIIDHYAKQKDYVIVLASPFKKLVQRDYNSLMEKEPAYRVVNYEMLKDEDINPYELSSADVHIITINSLLFNPGEENLEMTSKKRHYCNDIQEHCKRHKKKVVFVFDEIHAGIHCFQEEFIFNLRAWKDITHKCFVLSATFTEPARVAIEYIAYLTDYKIHIVETERSKFPSQANMHLYITDGKYSARDLSLLAPLQEIVEGAATSNKRVHIVTAFKEIAEKLVDKDEKENTLVQTIREKLNPNLVTGESNFDFDGTTSNIGTTFYTGIDLKHEDDVLVLIMPSAESQFADKIGGIFTTGKVAISQAIARLRTTGDIHVFMPKSELYIEGDYIEHVSPEIKGEESQPARNDDEQFALLSEFYKAQRLPVEKEIIKAEGELNNYRQGRENRAPLNYPSLASFILSKGMNYLIQRHASFGKGFTPYVLWAALNDQFENTTLKSIYFVSYATEKLELQKLKLREGLLNYYGGEQELRQLVEGKSFNQAYNILFRLLYYKIRSDSALGYRVKLYLDGKYFELKRTPVSVKQTIINILYWVAKGEQTNVDGGLWVRYQIAKYLDKKNYALKLEPESKWYIRLEETRQEFSDRVAKNNMTASPGLFDAAFLFECLEVIRGINKHDKFLSSKTFTFCRLVDAESAEGKSKRLSEKDIKSGGPHIDRLRKKIFQAYKSNFADGRFHKAGIAKVEAFYSIPEKHFFPDVYKELTLNQPKPKEHESAVITSLIELKAMSEAELKAEYKLSAQRVKEGLYNCDISEDDFEQLAIRHKAIQELLGVS